MLQVVKQVGTRSTTVPTRYPFSTRDEYCELIQASAISDDT